MPIFLQTKKLLNLTKTKFKIINKRAKKNEKVRRQRKILDDLNLPEKALLVAVASAFSMRELLAP